MHQLLNWHRSAPRLEPVAEGYWFFNGWYCQAGHLNIVLEPDIMIGRMIVGSDQKMFRNMLSFHPPTKLGTALSLSQ